MKAINIFHTAEQSKKKIGQFWKIQYEDDGCFLALCLRSKIVLLIN